MGGVMDYLELGISLIITVFVYLIFPICYKYTNGSVSPKVGRRIALWNSIICAIIFCLIRGIISGWQTVVTSFAPAVLYYFIVKLILIDKAIPDPIEKKETNSESFENRDEIEQEDYVLCKECGTQVFKDEEKCSNCATVNDFRIANLPEKDKKRDDKTSKVYQSKSVSIIKNLQIISVLIGVCLILFAIIYPISINAKANSKIPQYTDYKTIQLTKLDPNQKVYCEMVNNYNYIYIKDADGSISIYRFLNYTMYNSSNGVRGGYATNIQLKNYFTNNIYSGKPSIEYVMPTAPIIGWVLGTFLVVLVIIILFVIHRCAEEEIFKLKKTDREFKKLSNDFKNENISKYDYNKKIKELLSSKIIKNNKFLSLFKIIY